MATEQTIGTRWQMSEPCPGTIEWILHDAGVNAHRRGGILAAIELVSGTKDDLELIRSAPEMADKLDDRTTEIKLLKTKLERIRVIALDICYSRRGTPHESAHAIWEIITGETP